MLKLKGLTRNVFKAVQRTFMGKDLWPEAYFSLSAVSTHHQEEQQKHWGDEIHTNVYKSPLVGRGLVNPILPYAKAILCELIQCCLHFLTIKDSRVRHVPFPKWPLDARSLIQVQQQLVWQSHCSEPASSLFLILIDWVMSQTRYLTFLCFSSVVKSPCCCQIPIVSAAHWLTPTPAFIAQTWTCRVGIYIVLVFATTDSANQ